ncbi:MAG TPA: tetratricopeptide repeat protein [Bryobacteraceae bacterium]|nr:tetratricopeptide repeat protein [Bryobacteraceae bacterium]
MDSARWECIQTLFHQALDLPAPEQHPFLKAACSDDAALLAEVEALLAEDAQRGSLLERDVAHIAYDLLDHTGTPSPAPQRFGPYTVVRELGEGGMGTVYLAERQDLGNQVAIKVLRDAWVSSARRERFLSEQRMLAQLNHPSIARLYDADTLPDGTPWFVMEYVDGVPLTEYCRERKASIRERLELLRSVCEAVQYAHQHAVIHRDLKPSNILVKSDGAVRLLDFGIAKQLQDLDSPQDQARTVARLMTPAYAAPEQIRMQQTGVQTDVYSLGVILYELLTGRLPFDLSNRTPGEAESVVVAGDPETPSAVAGGAGPRAASSAAWSDLDVLCLSAMHKDPERRYRSIEALIRDLDHFLKNEPLEARPDNLPYKLGKFVRRNRRAVSASAVALAVVIGLVIFFTVRLAIARNVALAEARRTQRVQRFMTNLFEGGDKEAGPADSLRVVTLVDRGVQEARSLDAEPEIQAELYLTLGAIYQKLGKFDQADSLLRSSLDKRKRIFGADNRPVAESLVALGLLRVDQAQWDDAERLVRDGLAMSKRNLPASHPDIAKGTLALGKVLAGRGDYSHAIPMLKEVVRLRSTPDIAPIDLAAALTELANAHFYAGHYDDSDALNRRALAIYTQTFGEHHPLVANALINLGSSQFDRGNYAAAERLERKALVITEAWYGKDHPETASTQTILGRALMFQGHYDEAVQLFERTLAIQEHIYGPVHPRVASALNELGVAALRRGNFDEAIARFSRMAEIYRSLYHDKHYLIGLALSNLASVYIEKKDYARAEQLFREVIRRYSETLPSNHMFMGIAHIKLGRTLVRQHRYADAEPESLAGYDIVSKQANPQVSWLKSARQDLVTIYDALKEPEKAKRFQSQ